MADDIAGSGLSARRCKRRSTGDRLTLHLGRATLWAACVCAVGCASACASGCTPAPSAPRLSSPPAQEQATIMTSPTTLSTPAAPPGVTFAPAQLAALSARAQVPPRTRHLHPDGGPLYINRLAAESSPYLRQHAHNPVNWFPWGDEAFAQAKALDRPIFLSIGYSTCHWCHVMEEESFEDLEIARYINAHFIAIKVDREERPDVDDLYMTAVQMMTGRGGWPMTVALMPDKRPFFGATYIPPRAGARGARQGLLEILTALSSTYTDDRERAIEYAEELSAEIAREASPHDPADLPDATVLEAATSRFLNAFDARYGGVGGAPKFPQPSIYALLLRAHRRLQSETQTPILLATLTTLDAMARGGIYDHVGGGFHRYATDAQWLVPHFEKMLYDNAQLVTLYLEGYQASYQASPQPHLLTTARQTLAYVAAEMTAPGGGFFSATDADSDGEEGLFFVWTPAQLQEILTPQEAALVAAHYGVTEQGNFEHSATVLSVVKPLLDAAAVAQVPPADAPALLASARQKLYAARLLRVPPGLDDKVLTSWNGLMIDAFARAAWVMDSPDDLQRAAAAAGFIRAHLWANGRLLRTWRAGDAKGLGFLDDYAFMIHGLLSLFEASADPQWLRWAIDLQAVLDARFWDVERGGYFATSDEHEALLVRPKPDYDGAEPSGNAIAILNLLRLAHFTSDLTHHDHAIAALKAFSPSLKASPTAHARLLCALDMALGPSREVITILPTAPNPSAEAPLLDHLRRSFLPNDTLLTLREPLSPDLLALSPSLTGKTAINQQPTIYICEYGRCERPISDLPTLSQHLSSTR
jgi:uncharacterized protein YyaL (SSP411 family)